MVPFGHISGVVLFCSAQLDTEMETECLVPTLREAVLDSLRRKLLSMETRLAAALPAPVIIMPENGNTFIISY